MELFICLYVFIIGTIFASFINVYVTRTLDGESIVMPGSHCTNCGHMLKWYELIPIISYLVQGGKCRKCHAKIGVDSLIIEIVTGLLFLVVYLKYGISYRTLEGFLIAFVLIAICISDFKSMIILDSTIAIGVIGSLIITLLDTGFKGVYKSFLYGVFAFVMMFLVKIIGDKIFKRESLGGGDIKLAFLMGYILPYQKFLISLIIGSCIALPYALIVSHKRKVRELAFGPFLTMGLFIVFLFQDEITAVLNLMLG